MEARKPKYCKTWVDELKAVKTGTAFFPTKIPVWKLQVNGQNQIQAKPQLEQALACAGRPKFDHHDSITKIGLTYSYVHSL